MRSSDSPPLTDGTVGLFVSDMEQRETKYKYSILYSTGSSIGHPPCSWTSTRLLIGSAAEKAPSAGERGPLSCKPHHVSSAA